jgi:hypothetical protein
MWTARGANEPHRARVLQRNGAARVVPPPDDHGGDDMPALLPMLALSTQLVMVADKVPEFDPGPGCRAAVSAATMPQRNENACLADEKAAKTKLQQEWANFTPEQQRHCTRLSTTGGPASYVELLTCAEMSQAAAALPDHGRTTGGKIQK